MVEKTEKPKIKLAGDWNNDLVRGEIMLAMEELKQAGFEVNFVPQDNELATLIYEDLQFVGLDKIRYFIKNFKNFYEFAI